MCYVLEQWPAQGGIDPADLMVSRFSCPARSNVYIKAFVKKSSQSRCSHRASDSSLPSLIVSPLHRSLVLITLIAGGHIESTYTLGHSFSSFLVMVWSRKFAGTTVSNTCIKKSRMPTPGCHRPCTVAALKGVHCLESLHALLLGFTHYMLHEGRLVVVVPLLPPRHQQGEFPRYVRALDGVESLLLRGTDPVDGGRDTLDGLRRSPGWLRLASEFLPVAASVHNSKTALPVLFRYATATLCRRHAPLDSSSTLAHRCRRTRLLCLSARFARGFRL